MMKSNKGMIALAHNGNHTNAGEIRARMEAQGSIFQTSSDTEVIVHLIAQSREHTLPEAIADALRRVEGAFSLVMMSNDRRPKGMVAPYLLSEDASETVWGLAVFEDQQTYRDNANDPEQDVQYRRFRELLEADPEWHDGSIDAFRTS